MRRKASPPSAFKASATTRFPRSCAVSAARTTGMQHASKKIERLFMPIFGEPAILDPNSIYNPSHAHPQISGISPTIAIEMFARYTVPLKIIPQILSSQRRDAEICAPGAFSDGSFTEPAFTYDTQRKVFTPHDAPIYRA